MALAELVDFLWGCQYKFWLTRIGIARQIADLYAFNLETDSDAAWADTVLREKGLR